MVKCLRILHVAALCAITACSAPSAPDVAAPAFINDPNGAKALSDPLRSWSGPSNSILDELSAEETALASTALFQGQVTELLADRYTVTVERVFFSVGDKLHLVLRTPIWVYSAHDVVPIGSRPVIAVRASPYQQQVAVLMWGANAIGYADDKVLNYLGHDGAERYSLLRGNTLFACLASRSTTGMSCRNRRLRDFGILSNGQRRVFNALTIADPVVCEFWFLIRRRDANAIFPSIACPPDSGARGCATNRAFARRLKFVPSA
jgi:hypothetical protein